MAPGRRGHKRQREGAPGGDFSAGREPESPPLARAVGVGLVNAAYRSGDGRGLGDRRDRIRQERVDRPAEDVGAVQRVGGVELDGAVDLDDDELAVGAGQEVDADEVAFRCGGGANRQLAGLARRLDRLANGAERDVRPPFARRRDPLMAPTTELPATMTLTSWPLGGTSSCTSAPWLANQGRSAIAVR